MNASADTDFYGTFMGNFQVPNDTYTIRNTKRYMKFSRLMENKVFAPEYESELLLF